MFIILYLLLPGASAATAAHICIARLHLKHGLEHVLGRGGEEVNLSVGMEAIQVRALWWQRLVYVCVVTYRLQITKHY